MSVVIVGAGPAGAASAIFLARAGLEPLLLEERLPGGLLREANLVENYPGFPEGVAGKDLALLIGAHLDRLRVRVQTAKVKRVSAAGGSFEIESAGGDVFTADALVLATGTSPKRTTIPGADDVEDRRLFYGVSSLGRERVAGSRVLILGGGDAAFDYAINLAGKGGRITIASRSPPRCLPLLMERARERNVGVVTGCDAVAFDEREDGFAVALECDAGPREIICDLVVVAHGREPCLDILSPELRERIDFQKPPETGVPGLFMAGDVVRGINRQAAIAAGDGVLAGMLVQRYLDDGGEG